MEILFPDKQIRPMAKYRLDYIWLDGYTPVPNLRTKCCIKEFDEFPTLEQLPEWGFDGSSTQQAEGGDSDCVLKPVAIYADGTRENGALVMCEVMLPDGSPHPSNARATILDDENAWFGFEQEYFFEKDGNILGFPKGGYPEPQGGYYCGVGYKNVGDIGRAIADEHLDLCLYAGINHEGINAEVAMGQWEFQVFGRGSKRAADQIWVARFLSSVSAKSTVLISTITVSLSKVIGMVLECTVTSRLKSCGKKVVRNTSTNLWPLSRRIAWNTSRSTGPITTSDSLDSMRPNPSTNSLGELPTVEPLSEFHTHSPRMTGKVILRTADRIHKAIPMLSPAAFLKRSLKPTKLKPPLLELSTVTGSSGGRFLFLRIKSILRPLSQKKPQRLD
jgi:hypothetical protein